MVVQGLWCWSACSSKSVADVEPVESLTFTRHVLARNPEVSMRKLPEESELRVTDDSPAVWEATVTGELWAWRCAP